MQLEVSVKVGLYSPIADKLRKPFNSQSVTRIQWALQCLAVVGLHPFIATKLWKQKLRYMKLAME